jgi:uncharacterized protein YaiI (UPF0178 family)
MLLDILGNHAILFSLHTGRSKMPPMWLAAISMHGFPVLAERGAGLSEIFVDADGCPVKEDVYRVVERYGLRVTLVANGWLRIPEAEWLTLVVVGDGFDAADDWIVDHVSENDIVISGDIPLAARCLKKGARVLGLKGREFTDASICDALASRELLSQLRDSGIMTGGPAPFGQRDHSRFLQRLDALVHEVLPTDNLKKKS